MFWKLYHPFIEHEKIETVSLPFCAQPTTVRLKTSDVSVFNEVFIDEAYDIAFLHLNPTTIIDAGANVGYTSVFFASAYPRARIFAVEPEKGNFKMLLRNTALCPNIVPIHAALWPWEGKLQITNPNAERWAFQFAEWTKEKSLETVDALTLDKLLLMANTKTIDLLKLDIEGAEIELFSANYENWLKKTNAIIIELHDRLRKGCSEALSRAIDPYNFRKGVYRQHIVLYKRP